MIKYAKSPVFRMKPYPHRLANSKAGILSVGYTPVSSCVFCRNDISFSIFPVTYFFLFEIPAPQSLAFLPTSPSILLSLHQFQFCNPIFLHFRIEKRLSENSSQTAALYVAKILFWLFATSLYFHISLITVSPSNPFPAAILLNRFQKKERNLSPLLRSAQTIIQNIPATLCLRIALPVLLYDKYIRDRQNILRPLDIF